MMAILILWAVGCADSAPQWSPLDGPWDPDDPAASAVLAEPSADQPIDSAMAAAGERWYRSRGCLACHRMDGTDVVGPSLMAITTRREYGWYRAMVMNPDSMLVHDPVARELLEVYRVPMPNQGVSELEVRAMWEYHRRVSAPRRPDHNGRQRRFPESP